MQHKDKMLMDSSSSIGVLGAFDGISSTYDLDQYIGIMIVAGKEYAAKSGVVSKYFVVVEHSHDITVHEASTPIRWENWTSPEEGGYLSDCPEMGVYLREVYKQLVEARAGAKGFESDGKEAEL